MQIRKLFFLLLLFSTLVYAQAAKSPLKVPATRYDLYPVNANAQEEIQHALAKAGGRRVILVFGANWCADCFALDYGFHRPKVARLLKANFRVIHVNVGEYDKNLDLVAKYQIPLKKGIPSLAVIDAHGNLLYSTPEFEKARIMSETDVIAFLNSWKPPALKARK